MNIKEIIQEHHKLNAAQYHPSMIYRLWVYGNQGWGVQYYSQDFLSFGKKLTIARNYDKWAIERVADSRIIAQSKAQPDYEPPSDDYRDIEPEYTGDGFTEEYEWQPSEIARSFVRGDDPYEIWS